MYYGTVVVRRVDFLFSHVQPEASSPYLTPTKEQLFSIAMAASSKKAGSASLAAALDFGTGLDDEAAPGTAPSTTFWGDDVLNANGGGDEEDYDDGDDGGEGDGDEARSLRTAVTDGAATQLTGVRTQAGDTEYAHGRGRGPRFTEEAGGGGGGGGSSSDADADDPFGAEEVAHAAAGVVVDGDDDDAGLMGEAEEEKGGAPEALPAHACAYCGIYNPACVVKCATTNKWFCNARSGGAGGSHIIQHLVRGKFKEVSLHPDSPLGDAILECFNCGCRNSFLLGFIPSKTDSVVVLLCREPCLTLGALKDQGWDLTLWQPLVEDRSFLPWLVKAPSEEEVNRSRPISGVQIAELEALWRTVPDAKLEDLLRKADAAGGPDGGEQGRREARDGRFVCLFVCFVGACTSG